MRARGLILKLSTMALILFVFISCSELTEADGLDAHPAIWKLDNGSAQVYLIGSIHLLPPELKCLSQNSNAQRSALHLACRHRIPE